MTNGQNRYWICVLALAAIAVTQAFGLAGLRSPPSASAPFVEVTTGQLLTDSVVVAGRAMPLASVSPASCRYIVVYSPTCGASAAAARQWAQAGDWRRDTLVPPGWTAIWLSAYPASAGDSIVPSELPVVRASAQRRGQLEAALKLRAYPVSLVVDREGRVVDASVGAPLAPLHDMTADCRIRSSTSGPSTSGPGNT